jgi:Lecithin:cholesterol acyltransferase
VNRKKSSCPQKDAAEMKNLKNIILYLFACTVMSAVLTACTSFTDSYTSNAKFKNKKIIPGPLQKKAIAYEGIYRNPIIIVHGFLGSNMLDKKSGKNIWGKFSSTDGYSLSDEKMRALSIPMVKSKSLKNIKDDTVPDGALNTVEVKFLGMIFRENAYLNLVNTLHMVGYQLEGQALDPGKSFYNLFQFSYDWRRDLQENAVKLHEYIIEKKKYLQKKYEKLYGIKDYDVQFDLIGHSMGGLVARYYLRFGIADLPADNEKPKVTWAGSKCIDRVIIIGTPNAGYLDALLEMQKGTNLPPFSPALLSTWPTYYQMLPEASTKSVVYEHDRSKAVDIYDFETWVKMKWGLANPNQSKVLKVLLPNIKDPAERRIIALDHLKKCLKRAKKFKQAMRVHAAPPNDVKLYLILGNAVNTSRRATVNAKTGELKVIEYAPGDGKVLVSSALYDERDGKKNWVPFFYGPIAWDNIIKLRAAHMGITTDPAFRDNIIFPLCCVSTEGHENLIKEYHKKDQ